MAKTISKDGTPIGYEKKGNGPALIIVDGAMCSRLFGPSQKLAEILSPNFTVYTYDRRGRNESGDTRPYAIEREIEDLEAVMKEAGGSAGLVGFSSGASLALEAASSGVNATKIMAYEPPYMVSNEGHQSPADSKEQLTKLIAEDKRGAALKFFMHDMVGVPSFAVAIMSITPMWPKLKKVAHTLPYDATVLRNFKMPAEKFAGIKIPTWIGAGGKTQIRLRRAAEAVEKTVPGATLAILPGQTHNVSPKVIAPEIIKFFNS